MLNEFNVTTVKKPNILIVDNEYPIIDQITVALSQLPCLVESARDGSSAIRKTQVTKPNLIILDIDMPGMSGFEVFEMLARDSETKNISVIFLISTDKEKTKALQMGALDIIVKPLELEEVRTRINNYIKLYQLQQSLRMEIEFCEQMREKMEEKAKKLEQTNQDLKILAGKDEVTQTANNYKLEEHLNQEWYRMAREEQPLGIILVAIDNYKDYLLSNGHQAANNCLRQIATAIQDNLKRPADLIGHYRREVLMIILPNTPYNGILHIAKETKKTIEDLNIPFNKLSGLNLTISLGVSATIPHHKAPVEGLTKAAYEGLKVARTKGGSTIEFKDYQPS